MKKTRRKLRLRHTLDWVLASYVVPDDNYEAGPFIDLVLRLELLRRREKWAVALPVGFFAGNPRPGAVTPEHELEARQKLLASLRESHGARALSHRDSVERDGLVFYRPGAIKLFESVLPHAWLFRAMGRYLRHIQAHPDEVWRIYTPAAKERPLTDGRRSRGVKWTPQEDAILRQWFCAREDGKHHPLTPMQWTIVLTRLQERHPKYSVKCRIRALNAALKKSLMTDGMLTAASELVYRRQALGERVRVPLRRERELHGYYATHPSDQKRRRKRPHVGPIVAPASPPPSSPEPWVDAFLDWNQL